MLALWRSLVDAGEVPHRGQFDTLTLRPWLGHVMIHEAVDGRRDFRNRLEGSDVVRLTGEEGAGEGQDRVMQDIGRLHHPRRMLRARNRRTANRARPSCGWRRRMKAVHISTSDSADP